MPTKSSRARRWLKEGKAKIHPNDLNLFAIQLIDEPSGYESQKVVLGYDPGKLFAGVGIVSQKATLFRGHIVLPFQRVKARKEAHKILRRARRGRRINRNVPFCQRAHRQKRFENRKQKKLPPSVKANLELGMRIIKELISLFPLSKIVYEVVKADVNLSSGRKTARSGKGFSPVMVGQLQMIEKLKTILPTTELEGWKTSILRQQLGLEKDKQDKSNQDPSSHANDGIALAASEFVQYKSFSNAGGHGHHWVGRIELTDSPFRVITRPQLYRRQLHFENPSKGGIRKRKGGTVTPFGFRSGDYVEGTKAGKVARGWIGGYTNSKTKAVSIYDANWKRIGQFSPNKTKLLKRSTGLCIA